MTISSTVVAIVFNFVNAVSAQTGLPVVLLNRIDDIQEFWADAAQRICATTGDSFCSTDVQFMTDNTEITGMSRLITYTSNGETKKVCAVLPPIDDIDQNIVAESLGGTIMASAADKADSTSTWVWLTLYHVASCFYSDDTTLDLKRYASFATLGTAILEGEPDFTKPDTRSDFRKLAVASNSLAAYWAGGYGERLLFNLWETETAASLRNTYGCSVNVNSGSTLDTENITRDTTLGSTVDCSSGSTVEVNDNNLWLWMYNAGIGAPPVSYNSNLLFSDLNEAVKYTFNTAWDLASKY